MTVRKLYALYFSPTGGAEKIARYVAEELGRRLGLEPEYIPFTRPGEREEDYAAVLERDLETYEQERVRELGEGFTALAYPGGYYDTLTEVLIHQSGIPVTLSIDTDRRNVLVRGLPQSLYALCRWNVTPGMTGNEVVTMIAGGQAR